MKGYLPLIRKDSVTHTHGLAAYVKVGVGGVGVPFVRDYFQKTLRILIVFGWLYSFQFLTSFPSEPLLLL